MLRKLSQNARNVLWQFVRLVSWKRPGDPVKHPLQAIADELDVSLRTVDRAVAELVEVEVLERQQLVPGTRRDPWQDAHTRLRREALEDLGLLAPRTPKVTDPLDKVSEADGKLPAVENPGPQEQQPPAPMSEPAGVAPRSFDAPGARGIFVPAGLEALHERIGDGPLLGLLGLTAQVNKHRPVAERFKLQDVMARAGERVLEANDPVAYLRHLVLSGGSWTGPIKEKPRMAAPVQVANAGAYEVREPEAREGVTQEGRARGLSLVADLKARWGR